MLFKKSEIKRLLFLLTDPTFDLKVVREIKKHFKTRVFVLYLDLGSPRKIPPKLPKTSKEINSDEFVTMSCTQNLVDAYLTKSIKANGDFSGPGSVSTSLTYALIAEKVAAFATERGIDSIVHTLRTGSYEQFYFEGRILFLNPDARIFSISQLIPDQPQPHSWSHHSIWGTTMQSLTPPDHKNIPTTAQKTMPEATLELTFNAGIPTAINKLPLRLIDLISRLNELGQHYGVGENITIEDDITGFETWYKHSSPAAAILSLAHHALEALVGSKSEWEFKQIVDIRWQSLIKTSLWDEPLRADLESFIDTYNQKVNGTVRVNMASERLSVISIVSGSTVRQAAHAEQKLLPESFAHYIKLSAQRISLLQKPQSSVLISIGTRANKIKLLSTVKQLSQLSFKLYATYKTHKFLRGHGIPAILVHKISQPHLKPNLFDLLENNRFSLIIQIRTSPHPSLKEKSDGTMIAAFAKKHQTSLLDSIIKARTYVSELQKNYIQKISII